MPAFEAYFRFSANIFSSTLHPRLGHIRGITCDGDGKVIAGCTISIAGTARTAITDANGIFTLINIDVGVNTLVAQLAGYSDSMQSDIIIARGDNPGFRFVMQPARSFCVVFEFPE
jgi:hypothetical protein